MKTEEIIKEAEVMGFNAILYSMGDRVDLEIREKNYGELVAHTAVNKMFDVGICDGFYYRLEGKKKAKLFNLLTEYASTPIEERGEEKKYRYYLKKTTGLNLNHGNLLYKQKSFNNFMFDIDTFNQDEVKCEFTHRELRACGINLALLRENYEEIEV